MLDINEQKIIDLLLGENSIPVKLRWKENIDDDYKVLIYLLDKIIEKYKNKEYIPKKLSYAFLDISNCFDLSEKLYSEAELNHIEDLKNSLYEKLVELYES